MIDCHEVLAEEGAVVSKVDSGAGVGDAAGPVPAAPAEAVGVFPAYTEPPSYLTLRLLSVSTFTEPREAGLAMWPRSELTPASKVIKAESDLRQV